MSEESPEIQADARNWWIMFPITGLEITNDLPDLQSSMFGDATIVSRKHTKLLGDKWAETHQPDDKGKSESTAIQMG